MQLFDAEEVLGGVACRIGSLDVKDGDMNDWQRSASLMAKLCNSEDIVVASEARELVKRHIEEFLPHMQSAFASVANQILETPTDDRAILVELIFQILKQRQEIGNSKEVNLWWQRLAGRGLCLSPDDTLELERLKAAYVERQSKTVQVKALERSLRKAKHQLSQDRALNEELRELCLIRGPLSSSSSSAGDERMPEVLARMVEGIRIDLAGKVRREGTHANGGPFAAAVFAAGGGDVEDALRQLEKRVSAPDCGVQLGVVPSSGPLVEASDDEEARVRPMATAVRRTGPGEAWPDVKKFGTHLRVPSTEIPAIDGSRLRKSLAWVTSFGDDDCGADLENPAVMLPSPVGTRRPSPVQKKAHGPCPDPQKAKASAGVMMRLQRRQSMAVANWL